MIARLPRHGVSGFDVIKKIRRGATGGGISIQVIDSPCTGTSGVVAPGSMGADDFIDEKFTPPQLIGRVNSQPDRQRGA